MEVNNSKKHQNETRRKADERERQAKVTVSRGGCAQLLGAVLPRISFGSDFVVHPAGRPVGRETVGSPLPSIALSREEAHRVAHRETPTRLPCAPHDPRLKQEPGFADCVRKGEPLALAAD